MLLYPSLNNNAPRAHFVRSSHGLFTRYIALLLVSTYALALLIQFVIGAHPLLDYRFTLSAVPAPTKMKVPWQCTDLLFHYHTKVCDSSKAIKTSSRRPTKQCVYVLEPLYWYLHKVKKVRSNPLIREDQQSNKYAF